MGLNISEQETSVNFLRDSDICTIYTSDSTIMTKLDKLAESDNSPHWKLKEEHRLLTGELIGKTYETHKRLISFRSNITTREMSEEQKEAASERFRKMWKDKRKNEESEEIDT
jgi:hypothetical protein